MSVVARVPLDRYLDDDRILIDIETDFLMKVLEISVDELALSQEIQEFMLSLADRVHGGEVVSSADMYDGVNEIAERHGCEYGIPIPATGEMARNHLVMAPGVPLGHIIAGNQLMREDQERRERMQRGHMEAAQELIASGVCIRNSWRVVGDHTVCVVDTTQGPMAMQRYGAVQKLAKLINTVGTRIESHMSVEAEMKARESLKSKISEPQWRCYVLNDCFLERSERSDIHYLFRKGYPTIALSFHGEDAQQLGGRALAALCLHPMGFFQYTHAGLMTPTDEVICHLLLMRADERKFWAKSGQWAVTDTRSGI